ncbi:hypothetical protein SAMN05660479_00768 [Microbulbifer thermotolerans]|uniref:glycosyltransferase n=1 Tax=Microbulbifer thermotolerans TaxID=252514 RepID=UPI0008DEF8CA|nr:glycosyltransferase [Microbulbifer thermotolerans]MCX2794487.1 glycosyltransferase [Microbulbifer thermotolerans]SFB89632.1 hypothetical protein SAMN05660479_00768 [Microbulbifer thermotolerans]
MTDICSIVAVVVTHNRIDKLKKTLQCYLKSPIQKVLVVDNASTDSTALYLKELECLESDRISVLSLEKNVGGAGGYYYGLEYVKNNWVCQWVVLSDDDSYPDINAIDRFQSSEMINSNYKQIIAAKVLFPDGQACPMNRPMANPTLSLLLRNFIARDSLLALSDPSCEGDRLKPVMASSFVGMFIPLEALKNSEVMPCKEYFLYWDDISFCLDMRAEGIMVNYCEELIFYHDCPRRSGKISGTRFYYFVRNGLKTIKKFPALIRYPALAIKGASWFLQSIRQRSFKIYLRALRDA